MRQTTRTPASAASLPEDSWENIPTGINPELTKIAKALRKVPKEYRAEDFNPLPKVGEILLSSQESQKVRIAEIEKLSSQLDAHTNTVSDSKKRKRERAPSTHYTFFFLVYWEGFNKSIKSYSSIISHITNAQHNVQDLQGLLYTIEKVHGQESVLKGAFSQQPEDESSTNNDSSNSSSGGRGPPSSLTASADNSSAPPLQQQSQPPDGGNGKKGENNDAMKVTIRKTITTSAENVLSTKESKTKLTSLYSRYLESCETLALYDKM